MSKMWEDYAASIGKAVGDLTLAEKRQAELTGIMAETQHQVGDAAKYAKEFAGEQAKAAAETLKLRQAIGGAMVPVLNALLNVITPVISALADMVKQNPVIAAGIMAMAATLVTLVTGITSVIAALKALKPAINAVTLAMAKNPVMLGVIVGLTALAGIISVVTARSQQAKKAQEQYNEALKEHNRIVKEGIDISETAAIQQKVNQMKQLEAQYKSLNNELEYQKKLYDTLAAKGYEEPGSEAMDKSLKVMGDILELEKRIKNIADTMKEQFGATPKNIATFINDLTKAIEKANIASIEEYNNQAKTLAQRKLTVTELQRLIETYKKAEKGSAEWKKAEEELANTFPQFSTASGILIDAIESLVAAQNTAVDQEWANLQEKINIARKEAELRLKESEAQQAALEATIAGLKASESAYGIHIAALDSYVAQLDALKKGIQQQRDELNSLDALATASLDKIRGIKPAGGDYSSETNKALQDALRIHEYRVHLEQLTGDAIVADLQRIQKAHAKTAEERMDLDERIFDAKKRLLEEQTRAEEAAAEAERQRIDAMMEDIQKRTEGSEYWINRQKLYGNLNVQQEIDAYNRIIAYHKEFIKKIQADDKIAADEKRHIIEQEQRTIRDNEDKIFSIRKAAAEKAVNAYIDTMRRKYDWEEQQENDRLNQKLRDLDREYAEKESALRAQDRQEELNLLYEQERKFINATTQEGKERLARIQADIARLNRDAERERLEQEKQARADSIQQEILDNQNKYKKLRDDLEQQQSEMLAAAIEFTKKADQELVTANQGIADKLTEIIREFDTQANDLVQRGISNLQRLINQYKSMMADFKVSTGNLALPNGGSISTSGATGGGKSVVINDYGDKVLNGVDDIKDYGRELFNAAENAMRG